MFALLICILSVHQVNSACVTQLQGICPENKAVQDQIVETHNKFRREVKPPAKDMLMMIYDGELATKAQAWVNHCVLAHGDPSTRMIDGYQLGENMFYSTVPTPWQEVVAAWHSELEHYRYPEGSTNGKAIGHYTQTVWNSSWKVGCGVKLCPNGIYLYACQYFRAGNFRGWRPYKEGEPCALCPNNCEKNLCTNPCPSIDRYINCPGLNATLGCQNVDVANICPASCNCKDKIIPIQ